MASKKKTRAAGFTLIELMVAMAALAAISAMTWKAVDAMSGASEAARSKSEALLSLSRAAQILRQDLSGARCPWAPPTEALPLDPNGVPGLGGEDEEDSPGFGGGDEEESPVPTIASWDQERLMLTRDAGARGAQVVAWSPRPDGLARLAMAPSLDMASWRLAWEQASTWAADPKAPAPELAEVATHAGAMGLSGAGFRFGSTWSPTAPPLACPRFTDPTAIPIALQGAHAALAPSADTGLSGSLSISWASPLLQGARQ